MVDKKQSGQEAGEGTLASESTHRHPRAAACKGSSPLVSSCRAPSLHPASPCGDELNLKSCPDTQVTVPIVTHRKPRLPPILHVPYT